MVDTDQFKRMLRLELSDKSEKGVLNAVEQLRKRSDILTAEPNYIYYIGGHQTIRTMGTAINGDLMEQTE